MTSMQFVVQPLPGTDEQFLDRLREVSDKVNKLGFGSHRIFEQLKIPVKEVVIGPNHIGVLLEDGKAFRVSFSINSDRLDLTKPDLIKNNVSSVPNNTSNNKNNSTPASSRQLARSRARLMRTTSRTSSGGQGSGSRSTGVIIGGSSSSSRPLVTVPATYVPEELISQAEVVLQGKSRNLIIRELQRTNLDVNLAVNNLLSRDDEEADDTEESGDSYVPEDLISLLDNGFHAENNSVIIDPADGLFSEEIFSNYSSIRNLLFDRIRSERNQTNSSGNPDNSQSGRSSTSASGVLSGSNSLSAQISSVSADREAFSRWRDRQYYGPRRWLNKEEYNWEKDTDMKKKEQTSLPSPIWISEELQPWPDKTGTLRFKKIAALYSEFIGLSENGELHQWRWCDIEPFKSEADTVCYHPKVLSFGLSEAVEHISANFIRCSIVTESNRVATWMDEQLGYLGGKIEHGPTVFPEFTSDPIYSIHVCSLYTAVRTENNNVYWWGVLPFDQRRYLWDKFRTKAKKPFKTSTSDITVGMQVIMKKCPVYQIGSIGFTCVNGVPKVGQLLNSVWDFNDICRFKILNILPTVSTDKIQSSAACSINTEKDITKVISLAGNIQSTIGGNKANTISSNKESADRIDMPPPPSPASSTCSDTGGSASSHKRTKRMAAKDDVDGKKDEELWQLKDVVFVEDKIGPIGKVLKVDGDFVAVRFPITSPTCTGININENKEDDWQQCRLLRRDDVQIYKTAMSSRGPDCLQKTPKKINITHGNELSNFQLLALAVDTRGIHVVKKVYSKLFYSLYNLYNSKQEQNCLFPTDSHSFMGASTNNISMTSNNDCSGNTSTIFLRDGNRAIYPIAKDCVGSIKDPQWLDLPPIKSLSMTTISLSLNSNNLKTKICITAILFETQKLMPHILRCDVKNAIAVINVLEKSNRIDISSILEEKCDGGRNIFHACTVMCSPTSNKDSEEKKFPLSNLSSRPSSAAPGFSNSCSNDTSNVPGSSVTAFATISNYINREGRTVHLREMMINRQGNESDQSNNANIGNASSNIEDQFYAPPWSTESGTNSNSSINESSLPSLEEDSIKTINNTAQNSTNTIKLGSPIYTFDPIQRREQATLILQHMCSSAVFKPFIMQMLSTKDAQGQTPFMLSVSSRAYEAGLILLNTILAISENDTAAKDSMIFPPGAPPDQSPLHVICYNDTCSFTWTGADHINQNIFECKTCGLTGSLCCCTECARVCHKGHDCKLKRTSPTAYCDCWEKCKCKALIAGNQNKRFTLLCKLAASTDLVTKFNSKGESILLFLIQTVGRQATEQRQYRATSSRIRNVNNSGTNPAASRKTTSIETDADMPEHNLEPPKFAREALERLLNDWNAVKSMIMTGAEKFEGVYNQQHFSAESSSSENYNIYIQTQQGSTLLDKFTHNLFVKCSNEHLDTLLKTLVREMQNSTIEGRVIEAEDVARRFVRSVGRVFVIFNLEKLPCPERRKSNVTPNKHIQNCIKVFQTLFKISIQELCELSEALIAPVRLGVVRPTAPFVMSSSNFDTSDDLFSVEPLAPSNTLENVIEPIASHDPTQDQSVSFSLQSNYGIEGMDNLREASENEETSNRETNTQSQDEEMLEANRNDDVIQDDESDNDFPFNDAETESDSDDNQSNQDAQRSVQTGATAGSETDIGVLFLEDESGDSSPQDEDASEDGETDEHSDEFNFADHQLERRNVNPNARNELAPQSMQWAIRSRDTTRSSVRVPPGSSLVFIDPMALRRSTVQTNSTVTAPPPEQHTMATTASNLARAFGIIVRQISELLNILTHNLLNNIEMLLEISSNEVVDLQAFVEKRFKPTWDWMFSIMDGTEAQLKFGAYLTNYTDPNHPLHPLHPINLNTQSNTNQSNTATTVGGMNAVAATSRRDFFTYCLSLMRAHTSEHRDALPVLDITALRHIAYVLDALIYYMRNDTNMYEKMDSTQCGPILNVDTDETDDEILNISNEENFTDTANSIYNSNSSSATTSKKHSFFARSESTLSLGCLAPDGFDLPLDMALPLADKPHLLQPNYKREHLFANLPLPISTGNGNDSCHNNNEENSLNYPPTKLGFSNYFHGIDSKKTQLSQQETDSSALGENTEPYVLWKKKIFIDEKTSQSDEKILSECCKNPQESVDKLEENQPMDTDENKQNDSDSIMKNERVTTRPKIIVTPSDTQNDGSEIDANSPSCSAVRSVIVRAGSSNQIQDESMNTEDNIHKDEIKNNVPKASTAVFAARGFHFCNSFTIDSPSWNFLLGRWKLTLDLFGRVFMDDVGMENGSILPELRGFPVKEMRFRRHMEKLRNGQQRDLILCKLERNRDNLIIQTFKELNTQFGNQSSRGRPPLTFNRVKVTFKDEPGEGSGVARSFYTSISEALLDSGKIPNLESVQVGNNSKYGVPFSSILRKHGPSRPELLPVQRRGTGSKILWRTARERKNLNYDAKPYVPSTNNTDNSNENPNDHLSVHLQQLGERLHPKIYSINSTHASKITGMLLEIPTPQLLSILSSEETLRQKVNEALDLITFRQKSEANTSQSKKMVPVVLLEPCQVEDNDPLFYSPGKRGFYTPRQGYGSFERLNAFRNIGRLIGLCLLQNELLPLFLQRHVLKFILNRKIKFHDLAFFDPLIYESFRQLIQSSQSEDGEEAIARIDLNFVVDLMKEEGGGSIELIPGGRETQVTSSNLFEYIRRYTEYRLIKSQEKALEALKDGVFDVLPENCMSSLTAEDLRLLMNGVGDINVSTLISYTTFNDESSEGADKLLKFKRWFWSIVEKMNTLEKQDLVYFWTGSPALPASEEGFQPLPSVTIRPADDSHLPTANTCISRLYIPLYSSKSILRNKLLLAIKSKNFGFV